jgi:hypothetical protein
MDKQLLNRREFNRLGVALVSTLSSVGTMIMALSARSARAATPSVKFQDGTIVPALGQGSAGLGQGRRPEAAEEEALRTGPSFGMTLIDTAEMYGDGRSEKLIDHVSTPERICIGGRSKNASRSDVRRPRAEALVGSQHHQSQLSCSINEPAFPSRPGIPLPRRAA